ncbi:cohesin domain-containing protein [Undibacterium terreum]|uniref:Type II secretion system protein n=1 Tax=Undibacterium terreum TaxID=1224302 RepID=A0A916UTR0_9BURK|nr:cohesin domain-containing protein [Undibacterium terreum]GGC87195.1 type II secretion system protein [Undibacterium terreum]
MLCFSPFRRARTTFIIAIALAIAGCAAQTHHRTGMLAMERDDYVEGVNELRKAADLAPQDVEYRKDWLQQRETATAKLLAKADKALSEGHDSEAGQYFQIILKFDRENERAKRGNDIIVRNARAAEAAAEARKAVKEGNITQATQWVARALEGKPEQAEALAVKQEIEALQAKNLLTVPSFSALYKKPINLEFRDASLKMVFEALSRTTGINFIFDREVKSDQRTTIFLKQTTLEDAIDVILTTNQLDKKILNASSVLIYPNNPNKNKEYQDLVVKAFYLSNVEAKQAANMLKTVLKTKDIYVDDKVNMLVLRENPETIELAERLIALQDMDEPEVMLEVEVLEINRSRLMNLGVQFTNQFTIAPLGAQNSSGSGTGTGTGTAGSTTLPTYKLSDLKNLNSDLLGITVPTATINLQKTDGDANLLANPRLRVRDKEKAKIMIGDKVPVVTTTSTPNGFVAENIQYLDVGLKLEVEPNIHLHDEIGLKIALEVSSLVSTVKTSSGSQAYQIGTRNFTSALRLKDGETQVLAGLISDESRSAANGIPLLGDLPVLGRLFSSQNDNRQKTEIVMSITPHLIRNIRRKDPSSEAFWSGTESSLRTKPLQLRMLDGAVANQPNGVKQGANAPAAGLPVGAAAPAQGQAAAPDTSNITFQWKGPVQAKVGETITLELSMDSQNLLRAAPLQLQVDPAQFEIVSVKEGNYFTKNGKGSFNHVIDKPSGRVSVGASNAEGAKGAGQLLSVELKPLAPNPEAAVNILSMTPVGTGQAIGRPNMPVVYKIAVAP